MTRREPTLPSISRRAAISLLVLAFGLLPANAQGPKRITTEQPDSVPLFRSVSVSFDLLGAGELILGDYGQIEAALKVNLRDKYFPTLELGYGKADKEDPTTNVSYSTKAPYGRIGIDFNMLKNKHDDYRLYTGVRYGFTSFKYDVSAPGVVDPVWGGTTDLKTEDVSATCHWLEALVGIDAKIWGPVHLGWSIRYKRRIHHTEGDVGEPWYTPGFGRKATSRIGGSFNFTIEI